MPLVVSIQYVFLVYTHVHYIISVKAVYNIYLLKLLSVKCSFGCLEREGRCKLHVCIKRPSRGKLKLANSSWCVWTAQRLSSNTLTNSWLYSRQSLHQRCYVDRLVSHVWTIGQYVSELILCSTMCWWVATNQKTHSIRVVYLRDISQSGGRKSALLHLSKRFTVVRLCGTFHL